MPLYLKEEDVQHLLPIGAAIQCVEEVFRAIGAGGVHNLPRARAPIPGRGMLHVMAASWPQRGYLGLKAYTSLKGEAPRFLVHLYSAQDGSLVAILQADRLGQIRTGAATGVATRLLARPHARSLGLIGTGWQACTQFEAVCKVRPVREARVYSRDPDRRASFARRMQERTGIEVRPVETAEAAVREAEIVITATTSQRPVLLGDWLAPGTHINAVGSNAAGRAELHPGVVARAEVIAVDSLEQARVEAGDLIQAEAAGAFDWSQAVELPSVLTGAHPGRPHPEAITLFESQGIAAEDLAVAAYVYEQARRERRGEQIPVQGGSAKES